jgi:DNA repair exonuclease SbcCD nuclease subunit
MFRSGDPRVLHAADLHVGDSRNLPRYLERQQQALNELTRLSIEQKVDVALYAGDIFDAKYMRPREKDMFLQWLLANDRAAEMNGFSVVIEAGNHDEIEEGYTHLHGLRILQNHGTLRRTEIVVTPTTLGPYADRIYVAALPAGCVPIDQIDQTVMLMRRSLDAKLEAGGQNPDGIYFVVMLHEGVYGAVNEAGTYRVTKGPKLNPDLPVTYWALGDIHKPWQQILPNAWYPGSPIQHDFGDVSRERGCLLVNLDRPTQPEAVCVEGVRPLVTLYDVPDQWPDAIIRFAGSPDDIAAGNFPTDVVKVLPVVDDVGFSARETEDPFDQLDEVMREIGVPAEYHDEVRHEVASAL